MDQDQGWFVSGLYEPHQPQGCPITQTNRGEEEQDNPEHQAGAGFSPRSCCEGDSWQHSLCHSHQGLSTPPPLHLQVRTSSPCQELQFQVTRPCLSTKYLTSPTKESSPFRFADPSERRDSWIMPPSCQSQTAAAVHFQIEPCWASREFQAEQYSNENWVMKSLVFTSNFEIYWPG